MNTEIYYFTGTGNSLTIAREVAKMTSASLIPIASVITNDTIEINAEIIGIVFPVYYGDLPNIIKVFARKLTNIKGKYLFVIANYGGGRGVSIDTLSKIIKSRGTNISAQYGLHMPQNSFYKPWENHSKIINRCKKRLVKIAQNIIKKKRVHFSSTLLLDMLQIPLQILFESLTRNHLIKITNGSAEMTTEELIYLADKSFKANADCNGCGICSRVCPVNNIRLVDQKPTWLNHCENCIACYNWCPQKAIKNGLMDKDFYYHNPEVTQADFNAWKNNGK